MRDDVILQLAHLVMHGNMSQDMALINYDPAISSTFSEQLQVVRRWMPERARWGQCMSVFACGRIWSQHEIPRYELWCRVDPMSDIVPAEGVLSAAPSG